MGVKSRFSLHAALESLALSLPEAWVDYPWDYPSFKVRKKVFVFWAWPEQEFSFAVKLPHSREGLEALPFVTPTGYGLGKHGWFNVKVSRENSVPLELLSSWIMESYVANAPKSLAQQLLSQ